MPDTIAYEKWNSFSRITVGQPRGRGRRSGGRPHGLSQIRSSSAG